ncbi:chitin-binding type-4 domain-containing protein [Trichonephila clavata]|uniref:Chitin-binding type-4 domain-containing protein n=1 Tax=Trichonephila clavata TaxID=2740835 RepID=A0A8X6K7U5_TRICU|nr:chitin-binding type-4 domain-containing protein [Trichonephila clavata]
MWYLMVFISCCLLAGQVQGHGRLFEPPSRSSMWRFGYNTPPNYNDNELFCGGLYVHSIINRGKCGVCGDPYHLRQPRPNEAGGKYGLGIIVRNYTTGQVIKTTIDLTANHLGYFEFRICPNNDTKRIEDQDCLNKYPLQLADGSGTRFHVESWYMGWIDVYLQLPPKLTCSQCVLQWEYRGGIKQLGIMFKWKATAGCGPQETFRSCADVAILPKET